MQGIRFIQLHSVHALYLVLASISLLRISSADCATPWLFVGVCASWSSALPCSVYFSKCSQRVSAAARSRCVLSRGDLGRRVRGRILGKKSLASSFSQGPDIWCVPRIFFCRFHYSTVLTRFSLRYCLICSSCMPRPGARSPALLVK